VGVVGSKKARAVLGHSGRARGTRKKPPPPNDAPFADFSSTSAVPVALFSLPFFSPLFSSIKASTHAPARVGVVVVSTQSERGGGEEQSICFGKDDYLFVSLFLSFFLFFFLPLSFST
jgi:hypothetical protein